MGFRLWGRTESDTTEVTAIAIAIAILLQVVKLLPLIKVLEASLSTEENQLANTDGHPNCQVNSVLLLED